MKKSVAILLALGLLGMTLAAPSAAAHHADHEEDCRQGTFPPSIQQISECFNYACGLIVEHEPAKLGNCNDL